MRATALFRNIITASTGLDVVFIFFFLITNPTLWVVTGLSISISILFLIIYSSTFLYAGKMQGKNMKIVEQKSINWGFIGGMLFIINILFENFVPLPQPLSGFVTIFFMLCIFISFGASGFQSARKTQSIKFGIISAVLTSMLAVVFALLCGFVINLLFANHLEQGLLNSGEYQRSTIHNIHLFTVFNTLDSAFSHLIEAPIIALVFGSIGGVVGKLLGRKR